MIAPIGGSLGPELSTDAPTTPDTPTIHDDATFAAPETPPATHTPPATVEPPHPPLDGRRGWQRFVAGVALGALIGGIAGGTTASLLHDDQPAFVVAPPTSLPTALPPIGQAGDVAQIAESVSPAVVSIQATIAGFFGSRSGQGSGFIVSSDGIIVTNNHVVADATAITVHFADGTTRRADVVAADPDRDLAVIAVDAVDLPAVTLGSSSDLRPGDTVVAIGNALALGDSLTVTDGIISALDREITVDDGQVLSGLVQTSAPINPGNSGGPLLNSLGEVVGINTAVAGNAENIGFAIPLDSVRDTIDAAITADLPRVGFLGVSTITVTDAQVRRFGLGVDAGALVAEVDDGTAADRAGIVVGDVIVAVDGERIADSEALGDAIAGRDAGSEVTVTVFRDDAELDIAVTLGSRVERLE